MSTIRTDNAMNLEHYESNFVVPRQNIENVPEELHNARPISGSSGWKTAGRVALGIVTPNSSALPTLA